MAFTNLSSACSQTACREILSFLVQQRDCRAGVEREREGGREGGKEGVSEGGREGGSE